MADIVLKQKEAKTIRFTLRRSDTGAVIDIPDTATFTFEVRTTDADATDVITKADGDFDKTDKDSGTLKLDLSTSDLDLDVGKYVGELKSVLATDHTDKSNDITIEIQQATTD